MASESRSRFAGIAADIADALRDVVLPSGRSFLRFDESSKTSEVKTDVAAVEAAHVLLDALHKVEPRLNFTKSAFRSMSQTFLKETEERGDWKLAEKDVEGYLTTMSCRLMNLCHVVKQGECKKVLAKWVLQLPWRAGISQPRETILDDDDTPGEVAYKYGWDREARKAWRIPVGVNIKSKADVQKTKEFCVQVKMPSNLEAPVVAEWHDGHTWDVAEVNGADFSGGARKAPQTLHIYYEGEHKDTHHALVVKPRADRQPLMALYEQRAQILQVNVKDFESEAAAGTFLAQIGKAYAAGDIMKETLTSYRNELLLSVKAASKGGTMQPEVKKQVDSKKIKVDEGGSTPEGSHGTKKRHHSLRRRPAVAEEETPVSKRPVGSPIAAAEEHTEPLGELSEPWSPPMSGFFDT